MDMELRAITVKTGIQRSAREDFRAMHKADAALFPRVARLQRTRGFVSAALLRLGSWLEVRPEASLTAPESPAGSSYLAIGTCWLGQETSARSLDR